MRWWQVAAHPTVIRAGGLWALLRQARLAFRLLRDERVPTMAKLIVPAAMLYAVSPLDLVPDLIPLVGQVDDLGVCVLAVLAFIKLCPRHLVDEHEAALDGQEAPEPSTARRGDPVDARYQWVDDRAAR